ncbi:hypothetical protein [Paracoccus aestuariivivens]|uniref:Uncharacterized protein n=1 Tax=Paracoccus aestuariivivens TaxID=1820333 RepID=A0A6L6J643_9RHOB|nr:hypothetical protein [Paracoccus aestuariivivens]MTH77573.1 hypothetical protein [Paracoccus aestuariivivens]
MTTSPRAQAKQTAIAFLREARAAGWSRAKIEYRPDGTLLVDASMAEAETHDDFESTSMRMGK